MQCTTPCLDYFRSPCKGLELSRFLTEATPSGTTMAESRDDYAGFAQPESRHVDIYRLEAAR